MKRRTAWLGLVLCAVALLASQLPVDARAEAGSFQVGRAPDASIPKPNWGQSAHFAGETFFVSEDGRELWKTDGSAGGASMLIRIEPGSDNYSIQYLTVAGQRLFFTASDAAHDDELWVTDGSVEGTHMVRDINPGPEHSAPYDLVPFDGELYFFADDGSAHPLYQPQLWRSDGTEAGTRPLTHVYAADAPAATNPGEMTVIGDKLFFDLNDGVHGKELWKSDGTEAGTGMVADINLTPFYGEKYGSNSNPFEMTDVNGTLFFLADDGVNGVQLWKSDGTEGGTSLVRLINPGNEFHGGFGGGRLVSVGETLFFDADDSVHGGELWVTDGTEAGTRMVSDIRPGPESSWPGLSLLPLFEFETNWRGLTNVDGTLYFSADDGVHGRELWVSDGTEDGTRMIADINPTGSSNPAHLTGSEGSLLFTANDGTGVRAVWRATRTEAAEDTQPPQLQSLSIEPAEIDTSASERFVTVTAHLTDLSGLASGALNIIALSSPEFKQQTPFVTLGRVSGSDADGTFVANVPFKRFSQSGRWEISTFVIRDQAGNTAQFSVSALEERGFPHSVQVKAESPAVTQVDPGTGSEAGGTQVQISGSGLAGATAVDFGAAPAASFTVNSSSAITATAPAGTGTVDVSVTTPSGTSEVSAADRFTYVPDVSLTSSPDPSVRGQQVTLTAKVMPSAQGAPTPAGTITFIDGSTILKVANMSKGSATFKTTSLAAGEHKLSAIYNGDSNFGQSGSGVVFQLVKKAETAVTVASSLNPAPYGSAAILKATVEAVAPGAGTPAGTVTFREGETVLDTVQLSGKNASLSLKSLAPGSHSITASYSGDPNDEPSAAGPLTQTIVEAATETTLTSSLNPAAYGSSATLKATVETLAPSVATPEGTVTFHEGDIVLAAVPLSAAGVARYALKTTAPATYAITATYAGNADFEGSESSLEQTVTRAETELSLTSTLNPAPYGSSGTLKATVKALAPGAGVPFGTVTFREGETVLAIVPLSSGTAKLPLKSLLPSSHGITATYGGEANYQGSQASIDQEVVKATTELSLLSSKNPAPIGSSGTLKATLKVLAPGGGAPGGTVIFREGETVLATVPLSGGSVSYPLKSLPLGMHEVTAAYAGSTSYEASQGTIVETIVP